jgi:hypothetical protein
VRQQVVVCGECTEALQPGQLRNAKKAATIHRQSVTASQQQSRGKHGNYFTNP